MATYEFNEDRRDEREELERRYPPPARSRAVPPWVLLIPCIVAVVALIVWLAIYL